MTTWLKRINNIPSVIDSILSQTLKPDKICLNLSKEEFDNGNLIPKNVKDYIVNHPIIEINYIEGKNTKQWKKIIPTLLKYPKDWVICIDDDQIYKNDFISKLWEKHNSFPNNPITINSSFKVGGFLQHCGHGTLEHSKFYNNFNDIHNLEEIYDKFSSSDTFFTYLSNKCGYEFLPISNGFSLSRTFNEVEPLRKTSKTCQLKNINDTFKYFNENYGNITNNEKEKNIKQISYSYVNDIYQADVYRFNSNINKKQVIRKFR